MIHRRTHPQFVEGCWTCKVSTLQFNGRGLNDSDASRREKRWARDMPAYAQLVRDGFQPAHIDGCGDLVARDATRFEIESGQVHENRKMLNDAIKIVADATGSDPCVASATPVNVAA